MRVPRDRSRCNTTATRPRTEIKYSQYVHCNNYTRCPNYCVSRLHEPVILSTMGLFSRRKHACISSLLICTFVPCYLPQADCFLLSSRPRRGKRMDQAYNSIVWKYSCDETILIKCKTVIKIDGALIALLHFAPCPITLID